MKQTINSFKVFIGIGLIITVMLAGIVLFRVPISHSIPVAQAPTSAPYPLLSTPTPLSATPTPNVPLARMTTPVPLPVPSGFELIAVYGDTLLGYTAQGSISTLSVSSRVERTALTKKLLFPNVSERWVVGLEDKATKDGQPSYQLRVHDRQQNKELPMDGLAQANRGYLDLSGSIAIWSDWRNRQSEGRIDIYGYDLDKGIEFPVVQRSGSHIFPHISGVWVIYLEVPAKYEAHLRAVNLKTQEDFEIGTVRHPDDASTGHFHAIGGNQVAWTHCETAFGCAVHLYDLNTRTDRTLMDGGWWINQVTDEFLLYGGGNPYIYDLKHNVKIGVINGLPGQGVERVFMTDRRIIWSLRDVNSKAISAVYMADLLR
jgi:hypothetical protein